MPFSSPHYVSFARQLQFCVPSASELVAKGYGGGGGGVEGGDRGRDRGWEQGRGRGWGQGEG